ncbi:tetratricopeptide repeat protein [Clostridium sp. CCUG 7971]|uniref:tetratricopeptide repeat protein n=1 Tax=Clostridium sp. CCUG 7971 TaxID=2811414 RepID=UPI001ABA630D|nr:tetratricopeptide repeat protein [Clostridium sp. CCUG 7971]MBO3443890.1 tetratricopeptide repeat protein [Clostridium sp. CCUG 7971]
MSILAMLILFIYDFIILMPIISIILLIPGRVQGYYYRNHFKGRKLLNKKDYMKSIKYSKEFIEDIRLNNWKKKLIFLSWGIYSKDIEAMTLNNLGVAYLELGDLKVANEYFNEAIEIDSLY